ncbi:MAG: zinc ribbon domain-containing protein [Lachnospiraceae bacterium]|nr:zinc ribbon domain-containing protein [Lachnospiraceae bacterium]
MKYCSKCGNQMNDDVQFCPGCGTPVAGAKPAAPQAAAKPAKSGKGKGKLIGIGIAAILVIVVVVAIAGKLGAKKLDMKDYVTVNFNGFNSVGTASYDFDRVGLHLDAVNLTSPTSSEIDILNNLLNDISIRLSVNEDLSNGDQVEVTISHNADRLKKIGLKLTNTEFKVKVKDLEKLTKIDAFEEVELQTNGIAPRMNVYVDNVNISGLSLYYTVEPGSGLDIGDKVTVTVGNDEKSLLRQGYQLEATSKEFTIEKGDRYVTTPDDMTKEGLEAMKSQTEDSIDAYFAQNSSYISASDVKYLGTIVQMPKDSNGWYSNNTVYVIYTATVASVTGDFTAQTVYLPKSFSNVIIYEDGIQDYGNVNNGFHGSTTDMTFSWYSNVAGYNDLTKMFTELVRSNKDTYEFTMSSEIEKIYQ